MQNFQTHYNTHASSNQTRRNFHRIMQTTAALLSLAAVNLPTRAVSAHNHQPSPLRAQ